MGWFLREGSSSSWKVGWTERTLASLSAPPLPLVAMVGIVVVLLSISSYANYKSQVQKTMIGFKLFLLFLPLLLIFLANSVTKYGSLYIISPTTKREPATASQGGGSPWGVALLLILLVVLISYKSYFHSKWWAPVWGSY